MRNTPPYVSSDIPADLLLRLNSLNASEPVTFTLEADEEIRTKMEDLFAQMRAEDLVINLDVSRRQPSEDLVPFGHVDIVK
jgi:hypothetical protein